MKHPSSNKGDALSAIGLALLLVALGAAIIEGRGVRSASIQDSRIENEIEEQAEGGTIFQDCAVCPKMVVIAPGSFLMGSPESDDRARSNERPQRKITIGRPFAVSQFEVTFAEWIACSERGGCSHHPDDSGWGQGVRPVINVSWDDITNEYLPWLRRVTGHSYRLLTEAEWEYAARAGTTARYYWGDDPGKNNANCCGSESAWSNQQTAPVGSFKPNAFGLYDMHGNVFEWVQDCYSDDAHRTAPTDGSAAAEVPGCDRVLRGGSWMSNTRAMGAPFRNMIFPEYRLNGYGFRVARDLVGPQAR